MYHPFTKVPVLMCDSNPRPIKTKPPSQQHPALHTLGKDVCVVGVKEQPLTGDHQQANPTPGRLNNTMPFKKIIVFQMN